MKTSAYKKLKAKVKEESRIKAEIEAKIKRRYIALGKFYDEIFPSLTAKAMYDMSKEIQDTISFKIKFADMRFPNVCNIWGDAIQDPEVEGLEEPGIVELLTSAKGQANTKYANSFISKYGLFTVSHDYNLRNGNVVPRGSGIFATPAHQPWLCFSPFSSTGVIFYSPTKKTITNVTFDEVSATELEELVSKAFNADDYEKPYKKALVDKICSSESQPLSICSTMLMLLYSNIFKYGKNLKEKYVHEINWKSDPIGETRLELGSWLSNKLSEEYNCKSLPDFAGNMMEYTMHYISHSLNKIQFKE